MNHLDAKSTYSESEEDAEWIGIWDRDNPKSVYSRVPNRFREALDAIPKEMRFLDESELLKRFSPSPAIGEARLNFWDLFKNTSARLRMTEVFKSRGSFYQLIENPAKFMWFLIPPADFLTSQKSVLERSLEVLHRFVSGDNMWIETTVTRVDKDGNEIRTTKREINTKAVGEARKVMESMTDRIHGAVAMNLRVQSQHIAAPTAAQRIASMDVGQILSLADTPEIPPLPPVDPREIDAPKEFPHRFTAKASNKNFYGTDDKDPIQNPEHDLSDFMGTDE